MISGETAVFSPTLLNSLRLQFQLASPITEFDPVIYGTAVQVPDFHRRHVHFGDLAIGAADESPIPGERYAVDDSGQASRSSSART